jgi:hypothetical protein
LRSPRVVGAVVDLRGFITIGFTGVDDSLFPWPLVDELVREKEREVPKDAVVYLWWSWKW